MKLAILTLSLLLSGCAFFSPCGLARPDEYRDASNPVHDAELQRACYRAHGLAGEGIGAGSANPAPFPNTVFVIVD